MSMSMEEGAEFLRGDRKGILEFWHRRTTLERRYLIAIAVLGLLLFCFIISFICVSAESNDKSTKIDSLKEQIRELNHRLHDTTTSHPTRTTKRGTAKPKTTVTTTNPKTKKPTTKSTVTTPKTKKPATKITVPTPKTKKPTTKSTVPIPKTKKPTTKSTVPIPKTKKPTTKTTVITSKTTKPATKTTISSTSTKKTSSTRTNKVTSTSTSRKTTSTPSSNIIVSSSKSFFDIIKSLINTIISNKSKPAFKQAITTNQQQPSSTTKPMCTTPACQTAAERILKSMNSSVDPCQNFYNFACGNWPTSNSENIPPHANKWGNIQMLQQEVFQSIKTQLETVKQTPSEHFEDDDAITQEAQRPITAEGKARGFYQACMNLTSIALKGWTPMGNLIHKLNTSITKETFSKSLAVLRRNYGGNFLVSFAVAMDEMNSSRYIISVDQSSLGLDRTDLMLKTKAFKNYKNQACDSWTQAAALNLIDHSEIDHIVNSTLEFEFSLSALLAPKEDRRDGSQTYHLMNLKELQVLSQDSSLLGKDSIYLNWTEYMEVMFDGTGIVIGDDEPIIIREPKFFLQMMQLVQNTSWDTIVNYLSFRIMLLFGTEVANSFPRPVLPVNNKNRWIICLPNLNQFMGLELTQMYLTGHDVNEKIGSIDSMVSMLKHEFGNLIRYTPWMDNPIKYEAEQKLLEMTVNKKYPTIVTNEEQLNKVYESLTIDSTEHFPNVLSLLKWSTENNLLLLRTPVKPNGWQKPPTIVDAFYFPGLNSITIPIAIMQPPFYDLGLHSLNFGSLGMIIGHEITHGFDDQGRKYDAHGNLRNWWTNKTVEKFQEKADCFREQYSEFTVPNGKNGVIHVNGNLTLGENIADNGGVRVSFLALESYLDKQEEFLLPGLEHYSPEQLFFLSFANTWCSYSTIGGQVSQILTDVHSPNQFRVLGSLHNFEEFYQTWNCPYPKNYTQCRLW